jgi:quinol monooxygenase YgiN
MVRLTVGLRTTGRDASHLLESFRYLMVRTRLEPGCVECSTWADPDSYLHYMEEWATEDDLRRRVLSDRFLWLLTLLESASEPPTVHFDFVTTTRGLDYVAEVRQGGNHEANHR